MKARLLVVLAAGLMLGSNPAPDLGKVEQDQVIRPGSRWHRAYDGSVWEFKKDGSVQVRDKVGGNICWETDYTVNRKADPPHCDMQGGAKPAIYRLEGDRLYICLSAGWPAKRPTTFAVRPAANQYLVILKRLK